MAADSHCPRRRRLRLQLDREPPRRSPYRIYPRPPTPYPVLPNRLHSVAGPARPRTRSDTSRRLASRRVDGDRRYGARDPPRRNPKRDELELQLHIAAENAEINARQPKYQQIYRTRERSELDWLPAAFSKLDVGPK